jgi:hypothetical protein
MLLKIKTKLMGGVRPVQAVEKLFKGISADGSNNMIDYCNFRTRRSNC